MIKADRLDSLQVCRAVAALLVLLDHFTAESSYFLGKEFLNRFFIFGRSGVTFFFVLSGFIICYSHWNDINGNVDNLKKYFINRFTRIFPSYWPVLFIVAFMFVYFGGLSHNTFYQVKVEPIMFLKNFFLVAYDQNPLVTVAWTLEYEIIFYFFFSLFIISKRWASYLMFGWLFLIGMYNFGWLTPQNVVVKFFLSFYVTQFMIGCLAGYLVKTTQRGHLFHPFWIFLSGALAFLMVGIWEDYHYDKYSPAITTTLYAICSFNIIVGLVRMESIKKINCPKFLVLLGGASYALYLIHRTMLAVLYRVAQHFVHAGAPYAHVRYVILASLILGSVIATACIYHVFYEVPTMRFLRRKLKRIFFGYEPTLVKETG